MKTETKKYLKIGVIALILYLIAQNWLIVAGAFTTVLSAVSPLIVGGVIAYLVNIIMSFFERHWFPKSQKKAVVKSRRILCLIFAVLSMLAIVALVVLLVVPQLWDAVALLLSEVPEYMKKAVDWAESLEILPEDIFAMLENIDWKSQVSKIISTVTSGVGVPASDGCSSL